MHEISFMGQSLHFVLGLKSFKFIDKSLDLQSYGVPNILILFRVGRALDG